MNYYFLRSVERVHNSFHKNILYQQIDKLKVKIMICRNDRKGKYECFIK